MKQKTKFKQTEIEKIPEDWKVKPIGEAIDINPKRELKKGSKSKYVAMQDIKEFNKKILSFIFRDFKGGSKFKNGDTLMARITPCLENGKTAFVDFLEDKEVGAGSTEFIVLSGKEKETTNEFVYYLSISPAMRADAIQSMTGTSGRQRVQTDLLASKDVIIPPLPEQEKIAKILSDLDAKIELNNKTNQILESLGQTLFKKWFVDNPEREKWKERKLGEHGEFKNGINYLRDEKGNAEFLIINVRNISNNKWILKSILDKIKIDYNKAKDYLIEEKDIIIARSACPGKISLMLGDTDNIIYSGFSIRYRLNDLEKYFYLSFILENLSGEIKNFSIGTTLSSVNQETLKNIKIVIPDNKTLQNFNKIIKPIFNQISINCFQDQTLSQIRDALLPKLMSGEVRVK